MGLVIVAGMEPVAGYKLIRKLGQGGFGEVWEAEAPGGVRVAMKFIRLGTHQSQPELRALEIIRNIRHPHLLDVQFSVQFQDCIVIAMPLCDRSLWERLQECVEQGKPGIPRIELLGYMEELAKAIDFLNEPRHSSADGQLVGIQHRDIKPHNIFLVGGSVRLADFGLAKFFSDSLASHTGSMSPSYVAPEALKGAVSHQSDQYALGITYYQLRTHKLAISGSSIDGILYNHLYGKPDVSGIPEEEQPIVARALAKEPTDRWPNCQDFVAHLKQAMMAGSSGPSRSTQLPIDLFANNPVVQAPSQSSQTIPLGSRTESTASQRLMPRFNSPSPPGADDSLYAESHTLSPYEASVPTAPTPPEPHGPEQRRPGRRPFVAAAGIVGIGALLAGSTIAWLKTSQTINRSRQEPPSIQAHNSTTATSDTIRPTQPTTATSPSIPSLTPSTSSTRASTKPRLQTIQFEPPTAHVQINGKASVLNPKGEATLETSGTDSFTIMAEAEGFQPYKKTIQSADVSAPTFRIVLEPAPLSAIELAEKARRILRLHCLSCHGVAFQVPGLDILDRDSLVAPLNADRQAAVVPGNASRSPLWQKLEDDSPGNRLHRERTTGLERSLIRRWIEVGAPRPDVVPRPARTELEILNPIRAYLRALPEADREHQRFFTFTNLHNTPEITNEELGLYRAAFAKLLNSLSWQAEIVVPKAIDDDQLIFALDLRTIGWEKDKIWLDILASYPYALRHSGDPLQPIEEEIVDLSGEDILYLRADWFVATASRPPLYHRILRLPRTERELEAKIEVAPYDDTHGRPPARAGYAQSAVTGRNQVAERRQGAFGAYWKTYDFKAENPKQDIIRFPLGPSGFDSRFPELAFSPDGGLILFQLPNGLFASLIVDPQGARLDAASRSVAHDPLHSSGSSALVNGLACLTCHREGPIPVRDEVRLQSQAPHEARNLIESIYVTVPELETLRKADTKRFLDAVDRATRSFLPDRSVLTSEEGDLPEPIQLLARRFGKPLRVEDITIELGLTNADTIPERIQRIPRLLRLGLEPLVTGQPLSRETWTNAFGHAAVELNAGRLQTSF